MSTHLIYRRALATSFAAAAFLLGSLATAGAQTTVTPNAPTTCSSLYTRVSGAKPGVSGDPRVPATTTVPPVRANPEDHAGHVA